MFYIRFTAGRTNLAERDQVKTEMGFVCNKTDYSYQNIYFYRLYSLIISTFSRHEKRGE